MVRQTSIEAFHTIKNNGLLSKRRWEVYEFVFHHGPVTCRQTVKHIAKDKGESVSITYSSYSSRFSELERMGVIREIGTTLDPETNNTVILWDVTDKLPVKPKPSDKIKCTYCNGKGYIEQGKLF